MAASGTPSRDAEQIGRRIESWVAALRAKNLEGLLSHYAPDILAFDLAPPLQQRRDELRGGLAEWLPSWDGPITYELRDLTVTASEDVAFSHSLNRLAGKRTNGETTDVWLRSTVCFRKIDGEWMVVHEHASVPFYMDGSFRAAVDLKPEARP